MSKNSKQEHDNWVIATMPLSKQKYMNENNVMPKAERQLRFMLDVLHILHNADISPNNKIKSIANMMNMSFTDAYKNSLPLPIVKMMIKGDQVNDKNIKDKELIAYKDDKLSYMVFNHVLSFNTYNMSFLSYTTIMLSLNVPKQYILTSLGFPSSIEMKWDAIKKYIKLARIENQLNKKEIASKSKLSVPTYNKIENDLSVDMLYSLKIYTITSILNAFKYKHFDFDVYAPIKKKMIDRDLSTNCLSDNKQKGSYLFNVMKTRAGMKFPQYSEVMHRLDFTDAEIMNSLGLPSELKAEVPSMIEYVENTRTERKISQKTLTANAGISSGYYRKIIRNKKPTISVLILYRLTKSLELSIYA
ncbi:XRE family transcriptional regulator [Apilactobacillus micheneri]|uniref:helix-turn-helix transcriptional regulator n=1 Tax=Apilactobacillus micheneri TaxID=1899430 RepID=UPI00112AC5CB|nr:helix-turn-helix transcriptional regulator [Apilactobacillus micheneri]TPR49191.1 XRE family transcriptional regulator [Apilactobacillus micheneri]